MFKAPFSFTGRIRRLEWGLSILIYYGAQFTVGFILGFIGVTDGVTYGLEILYIAIMPILYFIIAQGAKRCHDRNCSGWWQLVPFYQLWMFFAEGTRGPNHYGLDPKLPTDTEYHDDEDDFISDEEWDAMSDEEKAEYEDSKNDDDIETDNDDINFDEKIKDDLGEAAFGTGSNSTSDKEITGGIGEFGMVKTNPIPLNGVFALAGYLPKLRHKETGNPIQFERTTDDDNTPIGSSISDFSGVGGATSAHNIGQNIDVYNIYDQSGLKLAKIYFHCYQPYNSSKAPKGFFLDSD